MKFGEPREEDAAVPIEVAIDDTLEFTNDKKLHVKNTGSTTAETTAEHYYGSFKFKNFCTVNSDGTQSLSAIQITKRKPMLIIVIEALDNNITYFSDLHLRHIWVCGSNNDASGATDSGWLYISKRSGPNSWDFTFGISPLISNKNAIYEDIKNKKFNYIVICE